MNQPRHQRPSGFIALFAVLALGAMVLALAVGQTRESPSTADPPTTSAFDCPQGTPDGFALSDVEGRSEAEVDRWAARRDWTVRVIVRDGQPLAQTDDYRTDRVNTQVEAGVVTRYCGNF